MEQQRTTKTCYKNGARPRKGAGGSITVQERFASSSRMSSDAFDRLTVGPLSAFSAGVAVCFGIGLVEGYTHLRPVGVTENTGTRRSTISGRLFLSRFYFAVRYGLAQILPSVIWGTQQSNIVASHIKFDQSQIFISNTLPPRRQLRVGNLVALRGAVAGSILLSQVLSITAVLQESRKAYSDKIYAGQEPPLLCSYENNTTASENNNGRTPGGDGDCDDGRCSASRPGVVIRLAGRESDVTSYGMVTMGRQRLWPVFEDPKQQVVREMVQEHATDTPADGKYRKMMNVFHYDWGGSHNSARIPVYWSVENGRYSHPDAWFPIPTSWLFDIQGDCSSTTSNKEGRKNKLLIMEADVTAGDGSLLSLSRDLTVDLDLDLREMSHGFRQLTQLATAEMDNTKENSLSILKVVLVDPDTPVESGGGRVSTAGKEIQVLMAEDCIVIDSRAAIIHALVSFLEQVYDNNEIDTATTTATKRGWSIGRRKDTSDTDTSTLRPVILETHSRAWFNSIRAELRHHGYNVLDRSDVVDYNSADDGPLDLPVLVYERSSADTVDTIHALADMRAIRPDRTCALLSDHHGLEAVSQVGLPPGATYICSSEIYHGAYQFVRDLAISGKNPEEIQARIDEGDAWKLKV